MAGCAAASSSLLKLIEQGHYDVQLDPNDRDRLITWMDTYAQRLGSFSKEQEGQLLQLREEMTTILKP